MKRPPAGLIACVALLAAYAAGVAWLAVATTPPLLPVQAREVFSSSRIVPPEPVSATRFGPTSKFTVGNAPAEVQVIRSQAELDGFATALTSPAAKWHQSVECSHALRAAGVNFDSEVVVVLRQHASTVEVVDFKPIRFRGRTLVCSVTAAPHHIGCGFDTQGTTTCSAFVVSRGVEAVEVELTDDGVRQPVRRVSLR